MNKAPRVPVPSAVLADVLSDDQTPPLVLGDMSPWVAQYAFPYWQTEWEERCIKLERRGRVGEDRWALTDGAHCYNKRTRRWEYESLPSSRSDRFLEECRLTIAEARPVIARTCWELHQHSVRKICRIVALQEQRKTERVAVKAQRHALVGALSAYLAVRYDQLPEGLVRTVLTSYAAREGS